MALEAKFTRADIQKYMQAQLERFDAFVIQRLRLVGERFVKNARDNADFIDQSGNLRSSIGYIILRNGTVIYHNVQKVSARKASSRAGKKVKIDGEEGVARANEILQALSGEFKKGYVLTVIAGMNYAAAVESKGRDVISGSSVIAEEALKRSIEQLQRKLKR